jgi:hypothetical protein
MHCSYCKASFIKKNRNGSVIWEHEIPANEDLISPSCQAMQSYIRFEDGYVQFAYLFMNENKQFILSKVSNYTKLRNYGNNIDVIKIDFILFKYSDNLMKELILTAERLQTLYAFT